MRKGAVHRSRSDTPLSPSDYRRKFRYDEKYPPEERKSFLESFSRQHEGWLVTLEVFAPEIWSTETSKRIAA